MCGDLSRAKSTNFATETRLGRPESFCFGDVESPLRIDDHAVVVLCFLRSDQTVEHIVEHTLRIASAWIAEAATAWEPETNGVAWRDGLPPLGPDRTVR